MCNITRTSKDSTRTALPKESPRMPCYCESNLKTQLGLKVLREGRHVASLGSLFQRNRWRLRPRRGDGAGGRGRGRSRRHARLHDEFLCRLCLLVLSVHGAFMF